MQKLNYANDLIQHDIKFMYAFILILNYLLCWL